MPKFRVRPSRRAKAFVAIDPFGRLVRSGHNVMYFKTIDGACKYIATLITLAKLRAI